MQTDLFEINSTAFKLLGISKKEFLVYQTIYNLGPTSVVNLSKILNLPRTTIYENLEKLINLKLINNAHLNKSKVFIANNPSIFNDILNEKIFILDQEILELITIRNSIAFTKKSEINKSNLIFKNNLQSLNFSAREIQIFLELDLEKGKTIQHISKKCNIPRTSIIDAVRRLEEKKCIKKVNGMIYAKDLKFIRTIADRNIDMLSNIKDRLLISKKDIKLLISNLSKGENSLLKTNIEYYEGIDAVESVYDETMDASEVNCFINVKRYYEVFPGTRYKFVKALKNNPNRKFISISVDSPTARYIKKTRTSERYESKLVSKEEDFGKLDFHIYDDKIAIFELDKNKPTAIVIDSPNIAKGLRAIHKLLWSNLK